MRANGGPGAIYSLAAVEPVILQADLFPPELTAIRITGLAIAATIAAFAIARRGALRNIDVIILLLIALGLAVVSGTQLLDAILSAFSFQRSNGTRIVGVAVFAILILFLLVVRALTQGSRITRELSSVLEGLAWEQFRIDGHPGGVGDKIGFLVPAYNEAESIAWVLDRIPASVSGAETAVLVVDDGSRDGTPEIAAQHGAVVARHLINRGGGAALRTGYRLMADSGASIVVTLDADGQHLPSEMERLVEPVASGQVAIAHGSPRARGGRPPVASGQVAIAHGSRVLGEAEPNHRARELGIVFFNRMVSLITRTKVSDCSNGYRAVRADVLPQLVLRQEQFHTSEFLIEAIKRGIPAKEVPVTVARRLHGHSKKPAVARYGMGFANAIFRTWLR